MEYLPEQQRLCCKARGKPQRSTWSVRTLHSFLLKLWKTTQNHIAFVSTKYHRGNVESITSLLLLRTLQKKKYSFTNYHTGRMQRSTKGASFLTFHEEKLISSTRKTLLQFAAVAACTEALKRLRSCQRAAPPDGSRLFASSTTTGSWQGRVHPLHLNPLLCRSIGFFVLSSLCSLSFWRGAVIMFACVSPSLSLVAYLY